MIFSYIFSLHLYKLRTLTLYDLKNSLVKDKRKIFDKKKICIENGALHVVWASWPVFFHLFLGNQTEGQGFTYFKFGGSNSPKESSEIVSTDSRNCNIKKNSCPPVFHLQHLLSLGGSCSISILLSLPKILLDFLDWV